MQIKNIPVNFILTHCTPRKIHFSSLPSIFLFWWSFQELVLKENMAVGVDTACFSRIEFFLSCKYVLSWFHCRLCFVSWFSLLLCLMFRNLPNMVRFQILLTATSLPSSTSYPSHHLIFPSRPPLFPSPSSPSPSFLSLHFHFSRLCLCLSSLFQYLSPFSFPSR